MGASSSKAKVRTYSYSEIAAAALYSVSSTCKGSTSSNQELDISGSTISGSVIRLSAKQRLECLSTVSADSSFDSKFQNAVDNLVKGHSTAAIGSSKNSTDVKNEIVSKMNQTMESHSSSELFGSSAQAQLVKITNATITNSTIDIQADSFVKVVSEILSKNGVKGEVTVEYKSDSDVTAGNAVTDLGDNAERAFSDATKVAGSAVTAVGDTAGGIIGVADGAVSGVLDIVGSPMFMIIAAVIVIAIIFIYLKSPTNPMGAMGALGAMSAPQQQWGPPAPPPQQWRPPMTSQQQWSG